MLNGLTQADRTDIRQLIPLFKALELGDEAKAKDCVQQSSTIVNRTHPRLDNVNALIASVQYPQIGCSLALFSEILNLTQNLNAQTLSKGKAAIHYLALDLNKHELLALLLAQGPLKVNINIKDKWGGTPALMAAFKGAAAALKLLIVHGADINLTNHMGQTPLMLACKEGHDICVQMLLAKGALVNIKDSEGRTAIHYLAQSQCANTQTKLTILNCLLEQGLEINEQARHGKNAIEMAGYLHQCDLLVDEMIANRVPSLVFLCNKMIVRNRLNPVINADVQSLPIDFIERIENTSRCTNTPP